MITSERTHTNAHSPIWQRLPSQPLGQKHWKEETPSMQVPPLRHGDKSQSLISGEGGGVTVIKSGEIERWGGRVNYKTINQ